MKNIRSSANYTWNTSFRLGKGATGDVYQGVDQNTGEPVAVKVFNLQSHYRPWELQRREFEVMKELSHKNIVKMIAEEKEEKSQSNVIIMELCKGGSLYTVLEEPENSFGLKEEEFLCALKDISAGMKYLRDKQIIHRDLKPGNILKYVSEDECCFKLSDFDAARYLADDEKFMSLYGTTEFLHPDLYERAYKKQPRVLSFGASVDLWSIGVTLYYIASCLLPFQPFDGKKDKNTMLTILSNKASGVISGVQHSKNGPIEWSRELPKTCLLSEDLKKLLTVLLAGILETDETKMWSFNKFFEYVTDISSRKIFDVLYVNEGKEFRLYMKPDEKLQDLKDKIYAQTRVPSSSQLLLFEKSLFTSQIDSSLDVSTFPSTADQPLVLLNLEHMKDIKELTELASLPAHFPTFPLTISALMIEDADSTKISCSIAYAVKRLVVKIVKYQKLLLNIPGILISQITNSVEKLKSADVLKEKYEDVNYRINFLEKIFSSVSKFASSLPNEHDYKKEYQQLSVTICEEMNSKNQLQQKIEELMSSIHLMKENVLISKQPQIQWMESLSDCPGLTGCIEKVNSYIENLHYSWQVFLRERNGAFNQKFHLLERTKVNGTNTKLINLKQECVNSYLQTSQKLIKWCRDIKTVMTNLHCLQEELVSVSDNLKCYSSSLQKTESKVYELNENVVLMSTKMSKKMPNRMTSKRKKAINILTQGFQDLSKIVEENDRLCERMSSLVT